MFEPDVESTATRSGPAGSPPPQAHGTCWRCGRSRRVIVGDGPAVCRTCVMAWIWLARLVTGGEAVPEPGLGALRHLEHGITPRLNCLHCRQRGLPWMGGGLDRAVDAR